jgi:hypothetical protein
MLKSLQDVIQDIEAGKRLALAGDEKLLLQLPKGNWIGGTIPYFMDAQGGIISRDRVFVQDLTDISTGASIHSYAATVLEKILVDAPENGFSILIVPATSPAHIAYAQNAPNYEDLFMKPILGWISGVHLEDLGNISPKVFNGLTGIASDQEAVVIHCSVPEEKHPSIGIVNLFKQGSGALIQFEQEGFQVKDCLIDGQRRNFAKYLTENAIDTRLPLVADYAGALVNVSFQGVKEVEGLVDLYAPVFEGVDYRIAAPVVNYLAEFRSALPKNTAAVFSCNCILNFLYSQLEGRVTEGMYGPITFGEIAYQLLNQTLVYLEIK